MSVLRDAIFGITIAVCAAGAAVIAAQVWNVLW
jgi:hypothetical protein